jgi:hypothetical protein
MLSVGRDHAVQRLDVPIHGQLAALETVDPERGEHVGELMRPWRITANAHAHAAVHIE